MAATAQKPLWRRILVLAVSLPLAVLGLATAYNVVVMPLLPKPELPAFAGDQPLAAVAETVRGAMDAPALGVMIVTPEGIERAFSGQRVAGGAAVQPGDRWHLGSNGKAFTAALYARLVDEGRARWGATVPELFPGLTGDPAWNTITIEDLLSHRAGVSDSALGGRLMGFHMDSRPLHEQRRAFAAEILGKAPAGTPGTFVYSNLSYMLAGEAIAAITGQPFEEAMTALFFRPLGLETAGFGAPMGEAPRGHGARWFGLLPRFPADPEGLADNPAVLSAGGRMHMSLGDWAKAIAIFTNGGAGYLKPETAAYLLSAGGDDYALGWGRRKGMAAPVFSHAGSNTMWFSLALIVPERQTAVLVTVNAGGGRIESLLGPFGRRLLTQVIGEPQPAPQ